MIHNNPGDINRALCRVLGIDIHNVTAVELSLSRPDQLPRVTITKIILGYDITETQQLFELHPLTSAMTLPQPEREPLDMDAMCEAALLRVKWLVNRLCDQAQTDLHRGFLQAARNLGFATTERLHDTDLEWLPIGRATPLFIDGAPA